MVGMLATRRNLSLQETKTASAEACGASFFAGRPRSDSTASQFTMPHGNADVGFSILPCSIIAQPAPAQTDQLKRASRHDGRTGK